LYGHDSRIGCGIVHVPNQFRKKFDHIRLDYDFMVFASHLRCGMPGNLRGIKRLEPDSMGMGR
jgi:hypothetical protein